MSKGEVQGRERPSRARCVALLGGVLWGMLLAGCGGQTARPSLFLPPGGEASLASPTPVALEQFSLLPTLPSEATVLPQPSFCRNDLQFLEDVTIPDGMLVAPGSVLDKQWHVKNSGECNWDERYRLRLVNGDALGAAPEQALYPARAGSEAILRILFTAPLLAGTYHSEWQAYAPDRTPFGDPVFIQIVVSP